MSKNILQLLILGFCIATTSQAQIITTMAGNGAGTFCCDGSQATAAELYAPEGVTIDASGNIYIADSYNSRVRKVSTTGIITTFAGNGALGYCCDGGQATAAELAQPMSVAIDDSGNVYVADMLNNNIRKVNKSGVISTFAGNGNSGYSGDGGAASAAELNTPIGIVADTLGNVYIADENNFRIRKVNKAGIISTFAGKSVQGNTGDGGQASAAELHSPYGVSVDALGNIYIADVGNQTIRKVSTLGIITTIAGDGTKGYSGDNGAATVAQLYNPTSVGFDTSGNIYIADYNNNRIRKVNSSGTITTIVGTGTKGYSGDGGAATAAELNYPNSVALDASGNIYIADEVNNRIRKVGAPVGINELIINTGISVYPNPSNGDFTIALQGVIGKPQIEIYNMLGQKIFQASLKTDNNEIDLRTQPLGLYLYRVVSENGEYISDGKLIIQ